MQSQTRHIPLQGTPNLRDLGGYPTQCGTTVKAEKLFRSGTLAYLDEQDWNKLADFKLSVICDFRREDERKMEPTVPPTEHGIRIIELPVGAGSHTGFVQQVLTIADRDDNAMFDVMVDINRAFVAEHREPFIQLLQQAAALGDDKSLLFHCSAGKDRTGFGAALLLSCLNVERDIIMQDYLLTREYFIPQTELQRLKQRIKGVDWASLFTERMLPMLETQAEYLLAAFNEIDTQWGGMDTFLSEALGVDAKMKQALQAKFLD